MTDVRLTALNPEDSTVVPVACNSSGELLVDKGAQGPDLNVEGDLSVGGSAEFAGDVTVGKSAVQNTTINDNGYIEIVTANSKAFSVSTNGSQTCVINKDGSADFDGRIKIGPGALAPAVEGSVYYSDSVNLRRDDGGAVYNIFKSGNTVRDITLQFKSDGSGKFSGDVTVGSRSKSWMLVEQGGLCHMVEQTRSLIDEGFSVDDADYPKLRDVFNELDLIERSLSQVMEKLRLTPPAGWPVWDGSDETQ